MSVTEIVKEIGYCSLVCPMCYERVACSGCKSARLSEARKKCVVRQCAISKSLACCGECDDAPCDLGVFSGPQATRLKAFTRYMKTESPELFVKYLLENSKREIVFGPQNPYDNCASEDEVIKLLTQGEKE